MTDAVRLLAALYTVPAVSLFALLDHMEWLDRGECLHVALLWPVTVGSAVARTAYRRWWV